MSRALNYIGIARKAGYLEVGEENTGAAVRGGKARLVMLAGDASENAVRRAKSFVYNRKTPLLTLPFTKLELSKQLGKTGCSMLALTDIGIAANLVSVLAGDQPGEYGRIAEMLSETNAKAIRRKQERKAFLRNKQWGKKIRRAKHE